MLDNVRYGPNGYAMHDESYAMDNEYHNNHVSMQMMMSPPRYSKQHLSSSYGTQQGAYPDGDWNVNTKFQNGWSGPNMHPNGWSGNTGYYSHASGGGGGGTYPGMSGPMMAPGRMSSNNMMMNDEYTTYQANPGRVRMPTYGYQYESYDDFANGGRQKVEWKNL